MPKEPEQARPRQGLEFEYNPEYLIVHAWAQRDTLELAIPAWRKIAAQAALHNYQRILVLEDVQTILTPINIFEFAERMPALGLAGIAIAFVDLHARLAEYKFGETVANNRGIFIKMFDNVAEAEQWLKGQKIREAD